MTGEFCRLPKRKCNKHYCWEKLRRAAIDQERLSQVKFQSRVAIFSLSVKAIFESWVLSISLALVRFCNFLAKFSNSGGQKMGVVPFDKSLNSEKKL